MERRRLQPAGPPAALSRNEDVPIKMHERKEGGIRASRPEAKWRTAIAAQVAAPSLLPMAVLATAHAGA